jgi:TolB-like protein/Flp pilus assembly protein TadD
MEEAFSRCIDALAGTRGVAPSDETRTLLAALRGGGAPTRRGSPLPAPMALARNPRAGGRGTRVGVMPPRALSGPGDAGLAAGLADEITTALARFRWLFLIASPSMAAVAQPGLETVRRWRELDLDFLLDGTLQRGPAIAGRPGVVRVSLRLLDMRGATVDAAGPAAAVVWSGRFDRAADDLLTLQDEIAAEAAAQIDPQLIQHESRRAGQRPANSATAYDLVLRAIPALQRLQELEFREAGDALARAATLDPGYAAAHAWWAYWHIFLVGQGWTADRAGAMARAGELAERAVSLDPGDARALTIAGHVRAFLHRRLDEALGLHERALALNPNLPLAWAFSGLALSYDGNHAEAVRRIGEARRLSPFDPLAFFFDASLMVPHLMLGAFGRVVELGRRAAVLNPTLSSTFKLLLSALGHMGAHDEAQQVRRKLLALEPDYTLAEATIRSTFRRPEDLALFRDGLAKGGLA